MLDQLIFHHQEQKFKNLIKKLSKNYNRQLILQHSILFFLCLALLTMTTEILRARPNLISQISPNVFGKVNE